MDCRICGKPPSGRVTEYLDSKTGAVTAVECEPCAAGARLDRFERTGHITTWLWTDSHFEVGDAEKRGPASGPRIQSLRRLVESMESLKEQVAEFDRDVWFGGLQVIVRASSSSALSGRAPLGPVLLLTTAGRAICTMIGPSGESVTVITDQSSPSPRMGVQGIDATADEARLLISGAVASFRDGTLIFSPDPEVGL